MPIIVQIYMPPSDVSGDIVSEHNMFEWCMKQNAGEQLRKIIEGVNIENKYQICK